MAYRLVAIAGPLDGERIQVGSSLAIGRSSRGLTLPDATVSIRHAEVSVVDDRVWVKDLGSKTGTRVGDHAVDEVGRALAVGEHLRIGESVFRLENTQSVLLKTALQATGPLLGVVLATLVILVWRGGPVAHTLTFAEPVRTPAPVTELTVPLDWLRTYGLDVAAIGIQGVRDENGDGIDEIWLRAGDGVHLVTHDADGEWRELGVFPPGCRALPSTGGWPEIACGSVFYGMATEGYVPATVDRPVVWVRGDRDLVPLRVDVADVRAYSGLLAANGVMLPTHLLVCEDVFPGVPAQAVTQGGRIVPLSRGCGTALSIEGSRAGDRVVAVASTESARMGFAPALAAALGGGRDGTLLTAAVADSIRTVGDWPIDDKGDLLVSGGALQGLQGPAPEQADLVYELRTQTEQSPTHERVLVEPGTTRIEFGECTYVVDVAEFRCAIARGCLPGASFVSVVEEGCGDPRTVVDAGYGGGRLSGTTDHVRVGVVVEADGGALISDVRRVAVGLTPL